MKNLKRIITLLVLTMTMFSCQTNDELIEMETISKEKLIENSNRTREDLPVKVLIQFENEASREFQVEIRSSFMQHPDINFVSWESCSEIGLNKEVWTIESITHGEFFSVAKSLGYGNVIITELVLEQNGNDPSGEDDYMIYFNASCSTVLD